MPEPLQLHSGEPARIGQAAMAKRIHDHAIRRAQQRAQYRHIRQIA